MLRLRLSGDQAELLVVYGRRRVGKIELLDRLAPYIDGHDGTARRCVFSRSGFSSRLRSFADADPQLGLITPVDIYA